LLDIQFGLTLSEQSFLASLLHHLYKNPQVFNESAVSALTDSMLPLQLGLNGSKIVKERLQPEAINEVLSSFTCKVAGRQKFDDGLVDAEIRIEVYIYFFAGFNLW
jgi:hypothetical protein